MSKPNPYVLSKPALEALRIWQRDAKPTPQELEERRWRYFVPFEEPHGRRMSLIVRKRLLDDHCRALDAYLKTTEELKAIQLQREMLEHGEEAEAEPETAAAPELVDLTGEADSDTESSGAASAGSKRRRHAEPEPEPEEEEEEEEEEDEFDNALPCARMKIGRR